MVVHQRKGDIQHERWRTAGKVSRKNGGVHYERWCSAEKKLYSVHTAGGMDEDAVQYMYSKRDGVKGMHVQ